METIASKDNPKVRSYIKLASQKKERMASGRFVLEGVKLLEEAVWSGLGIESVFITEGCLESGRGELGVLRELSEKTFLVAGAAADRIFQSQSPQGVGAVCRIPVREPVLTDQGRYLGLWNIQDPGNVGTMIRTAEALGFDGVIVSENSCDLFSPKTVRAAMGALFRMPLLRTDMALFLKENKGVLHSFASVVDPSAPLLTETEFPGGSLMLIGNEGNGLSPEQVALCDERITIPMKGRTESFNAAMAATILMWEMTRSRGSSHGGF